MSDKSTDTEPCPLCRDGWPRVTPDGGKTWLHSLPEPAGDWKCWHSEKEPANG